MKTFYTLLCVVKYGVEMSQEGGPGPVTKKGVSSTELINKVGATTKKVNRVAHSLQKFAEMLRTVW